MQSLFPSRNFEVKVGSELPEPHPAVASRGLPRKPVFFSLPDAETAIARVAEHVRQGGHGIPEVVIRRRFAAGLRNLERAYKSAVDAWALFDNMGETPVLLELEANK